MQVQVKTSDRTHPGRKRPSNQDFVTFFEPNTEDDLLNSGRLYIVADGVGGASRGDRASQYAAQRVSYGYYRQPEVEIGERLQHLMRQAGNEIYRFAENSQNFTRMATTMVAAVILGDKLTIANVGDSRAYLIREGNIKQLTRDHSLVGEMIRDGTMTEDEAMRSKIKNRITRSLGGETNVHVDVFRDIPLHEGDKILLCSDGLTSYANRSTILKLTTEGDSGEIGNQLVDFANRMGGKDNISVIFIEVTAVVDDIAELEYQRGQIPTKVDWDSMQTDPGFGYQLLHKQSFRERFRNLPTGANYAMIGVLVIGIFFIGLSIFGTFSGDQGTRMKPPPLTPGESITAIETEDNKNLLGMRETSIPTTVPAYPGSDPQDGELTSIQAITENHTLTPTLTLTTSMASNIPLTTTQSLTPTFSLTTTQALTITKPLTNTQESNLVTCRYKYIYDSDIQSDLTNLLRLKFGILFINLENRQFDLDTYLNYVNKIKCAKIEGNPCKFNSDPDSNRYFVVINGWIMIFPDVSQNKCIEAGGEIVDN